MERNDKLVYVFDKNIPLVTVASDLDQNVSLLEVDENVVADTLAVIHESFVNIIPILHPHRRARYVSITSSEKRDTERVAQVKWLKINNDTLFVVLSTLGLQVYDLQVNDIIYQHCCREGAYNMNYASGACVIQNLLCVSTSLGAIWLFKPNNANTDFSLVGKHYAHDNSIDLLDGCDNLLVSCSDEKTYVWKMKMADIEIIREIVIPGMDTIPTSMKVSTSQLFIGYDSGEFSIHDLISESVCVREIAHTLKVVDIDFSPLTYMFLTASQDGYIKVWAFNQKTLKVHCRYTLYCENGPLCGARFLNFVCTAFCYVTVGELDVKCYKTIDGGGDIGFTESVKFDENFKKRYAKKEMVTTYV